MGLYRTKIAEGSHYNHLATDRFKTGYFSVNFILPLKRDTVPYYALLPRVLRCGCQSFPNRRTIVRRLEELYGGDIYIRHYGRGDKQIVSFSADFIDNAFLPPDETIDVMGQTVSLLKDLMLSPAIKNGLFLQEYVENERKNCADAVRSIVNNKQQYAVHRCTSLMCSQETIGIPILGEVEDFDRIDPHRLVALYTDMLKNAQIEVFYVGAEPQEGVQAIATDLIDSIERDHITDTYAALPLRRATEEHSHEEEIAAKQGKLVLGFRTGVLMQDKEQLLYALFNEVYGGSPSSKLFMNVREKKSLCYSCFASSDLLKGIMYVVAGIENEQKDTAIAEICLQLEQIRKAAITEEELCCAKQSLANGYRSLHDSAEGLEAWYMRRILGNCMLAPEEAAEQVMAFSAQDLAKIAQGVSLDTIYFLRGTQSGDEEDEEFDE